MAQTENEIYYPGVSQADYQKIADILDELKKMAESIDEAVGKLVPKEEGKGLSENDYSDEDKEAVENAEDSNNRVESLSPQSTNDQYPSAKCVYDLVKLLKEVTGTFTTTYSTSSNYVAGDIVVYSGKIYECTDNTTGNWDSTKWSEISLQDEIESLMQEILNARESTEKSKTFASVDARFEELEEEMSDALQVDEEEEVTIYD